jgi:3-methylcrotonyl-CoA carboxylase alpha subunit
MFRKVLIANRGEIAVRIAQTLQEHGICAAAVYSDADRDAVHVRAADEAHALGGQTPAESYLQGAAIIEIARAQGADAIHPGYGFLSENADFAAACTQAGITFIGPPPAVIGAMGDKIAARDLAVKAGLPVVPGFCGTPATTAAEYAARAAAIGYPMLVKAAAGGGGKGMRRVQDASALPEALAAAGREASAAFGDGRIFLEKYITRPRHVEVQIFGDAHGQVLHLLERECSIQRRYQKLVEESPSPAVDDDLRARMTDAAVRLGRAIGYTNAGTVEFILDEMGAFYFLEVNARLQVEHPVTEMITGLDAVWLQLLAAAGKPLPVAQHDVRARGHALEVRICAEDPSRDFLPCTGRIERYIPPAGPSIRVDGGVAAGDDVGVHYDPLLAKLIVMGGDRGAAIEKLVWALRRFVILGVTTNISFLHDLVAHAEFRAGRLHTHFIDEHEVGADEPEIDELAMAAAALSAQPAAGPAQGSHADPWLAGGSWRAWRS